MRAIQTEEDLKELDTTLLVPQPISIIEHHQRSRSEIGFIDEAELSPHQQRTGTVMEEVLSSED